MPAYGGKTIVVDNMIDKRKNHSGGDTTENVKKHIGENILSDMTLSEMRSFFSAIGEKPFRANQVYRWIHKGAASFAEMNNIPQSLKNKLAREAAIATMETVIVQQSKTDGTRKYLFQLADGNCIESVFMKYQYGNSICVSSQAGCAMGCAFCASTRNGIVRNLTGGEMVGQLLAAEKDTGEKINHLVVMGSGEPFENYEELCRFLEMLHEKEGLSIGFRNITISTCGLVPYIKRFAEDYPQVNLAVSLHAADDILRRRLMPVNRRYPLKELLQACRDYVEKTHRRITFEYALIRGINDSPEDIKKLADILSNIHCHVNLIPLNGVSETGFTGSSRKEALEYAKFLESTGIPATVRRQLGDDIDAACGQLRLSKKEAKSNSK